MAKAVGIDLGTTNSVIATVPRVGRTLIAGDVAEGARIRIDLTGGDFDVTYEAPSPTVSA
jgi:molecular chaperone DnaK (HSP70)